MVKKNLRPHRKNIQKYRLWIAVAVVALVVVGLLIWQRAPVRPAFDGERAFADLVRQVEFGPRISGTEGHAQCLDFLQSELGRYADAVRLHTFSYVDQHDTTVVLHGTNVIASFNLEPRRRERVMLGAHWDTRPWADEDPDPANRDQPVPGANDGASGVAVLLEMARVLHENPLDYGVDIILFDLEDYGDPGGAADSGPYNPFSIGASAFVEAMPAYRPAFGIIVDMVGWRELSIPREGYSQMHAPHVVDRVWEAAARAGADAFQDRRGQAVYDDHVPFLEQGIPVINIIDFNYPYWHTVEDTPDKCSPESLAQVGRTLVEVLYSR